MHVSALPIPCKQSMRAEHAHLHCRQRNPSLTQTATAHTAQPSLTHMLSRGTRSAVQLATKETCPGRSTYSATQLKAILHRRNHTKPRVITRRIFPKQELAQRSPWLRAAQPRARAAQHSLSQTCRKQGRAYPSSTTAWPGRSTPMWSAARAAKWCGLRSCALATAETPGLSKVPAVSARVRPKEPHTTSATSCCKESPCASASRQHHTLTMQVDCTLP